MLRLLTTLMIMLVTCASANAEIESHDISVTINVFSQSAMIVDKATVKLETGQFSFIVPMNATDFYFTINGNFCEYQSDNYLRRAEDLAPTATVYDNIPVGVEAKVVTFNVAEDSANPLYNQLACAKPGKHELVVSYSAKFDESVENARFSNENVGREISGTIIDKGAYLSPSSFYYPQSGDGPCSFSITANIPADWESVADGNLISSTVDGDRKIQKWSNPYQSDGLMFFAAPFVTKSSMAGNVEVACYFFQEDSSLIDDYLKSTVDYIKMYGELIGPYPYERFTVAENFFPTGYGMPAWTLLGQQVIRLPFIKATSLGHEVLHNWWGNSVYVDYTRGNWCESATVYGADYRYKLKQSPEAARDYRKNILKEYNSYVNEGNDFPIRDFQSRTSPDTRTIGYNKAMMVWHLINEQIGDEAFFGAWQDIYEEYIGREIAWEEWIAAFEKRCDCDLSYIIPQWIDRSGAPKIGLELIESERSGDRNRITFRLTQSAATPYNLQIPLHFDDSMDGYDTTVALSVSDLEISMDVSGSFVALSVDPNFHIFRRLYDSEIEPIVSAVLGFESMQFGSGPLSDDMKEAAIEFGRNVNGQDSVTILPLAETARDIADASLLAINPEQYPDYLTDLIVDAGDTIFVDGTPYARAGHTFVLTAQDWLTYDKCMIVVSDDIKSLPRIGQLVPHYGKYSYLVFEGARNVAKGQWPVTDSPLRVEL